MDVGSVAQLSGGSQAVDQPPRDGVATEYRPVGVRTEPTRKWSPRCSYGTSFVLIISYHRYKCIGINNAEMILASCQQPSCSDAVSDYVD